MGRSYSRRGFLAAIAAAAVGGTVSALDLEKLLWVPGAKTHILPPAGGWRTPFYFNGIEQFSVAFDWSKTSDYAAIVARQRDGKIVNFFPERAYSKQELVDISLRDMYQMEVVDHDLVQSFENYDELVKQRTQKIIQQMADEIDKQLLTVIDRTYPHTQVGQTVNLRIPQRYRVAQS